MNLRERNSKDKKIYVLQDSTFSTEIRKIKMVKAFILDTAFKNDYQVEWLYQIE
jgi:hypothetical protein